MVPTAPEAAETSRVSPAFRCATLCRPAQAVMPGMPRAPRKRWGGRVVSGGRVSWAAFATKASRQPSMLLTRSPTLKSGWRDACTVPMAPPSRGPLRGREERSFCLAHAAAHVGVHRQPLVGDLHLSLLQGGQGTSRRAKSLRVGRPVGRRSSWI